MNVFESFFQEKQRNILIVTNDKQDTHTHTHTEQITSAQVLIVVVDCCRTMEALVYNASSGSGTGSHGRGIFEIGGVEVVTQHVANLRPRLRLFNASLTNNTSGVCRVDYVPSLEEYFRGE